MSLVIARTADGWWRVQGDTAVGLPVPAVSTAQLLADVPALSDAEGPRVPVSQLELLSPVTAPCRVVAQMVNYRSHARDSGIDPNTVAPTFFRKESASITGPGVYQGPCAGRSRTR